MASFDERKSFPKTTKGRDDKSNEQVVGKDGNS